MGKLRSHIRTVIIAILLIILVVSVIIGNILNSTFNCYISKSDDGFVVRTGFELIEDYNNNIKYEEISINR